MTNWDHKKLYDLKGQIVSLGVKAITGMEMPVFQKRRFQHGAASEHAFKSLFPLKEIAYRKEFLSTYDEKS
jgi:asparagine synthase (glutamine-hydrolysing)